MQLIPKSEDPTSTRTNIKSFLTKFLKNKNKKILFFGWNPPPPPQKKKIKLVFLYQCKRVRYDCVKKSHYFAIIYRRNEHFITVEEKWVIYKIEIYLYKLDGKYENKTHTLIK